MIPLRDEDPIRTVPVWTAVLILLNLAVFLYEVRLPAARARELLESFGAVPYEISRFTRLPGRPPLPPFVTLITSQYLHGGWVHLAGNLLYLWTFGRRVEEAMGRFGFPLFYTLAGMVAGLTQIVMTPQSRTPLIGASGAIAGLLGAYLVRFPLARLRILVPLGWIFPVIRLPAFVFLAGWFLLQWYSAGGPGGVAWWAHIGGFVAGLLLGGMPFRRRRSR